MNFFYWMLYKRRVRLLTLVILLLIGGAALAQDPVISLNVTTKDDDSGKKLSGAVLEVYKDGKLFVTKNSASTGKVPPVDLPIGSNYKIVIKKDGYVPKVATFDGHFDYPEDLPPFVPFPMQTALFREVEGVDFDWLKTTPMIKFELDQYGQTTWDQAYTKQMLKKIEDLKEEMAEKAEEEAKKKAEFEAFVKSGDLNVSKEEYEKAIQNYNSALDIFDDAEVKKKRDNAQKAWDEKKAGEELDKKFQDLMTQAKDKFSAKSYNEALDLYKKASELKPTESLPKDRITEIEKILSDQAALEEKFNDFVSLGDKAMSSEAFDDAITNYQSALDLKNDPAVKAKLEDAKKKKEDKEKADAAAKELEAKYDDLITQADKAFDAKSYEDAMEKYQEALTLKPGESHPSARISEIEDILKKLKEEEDAAKRLEEQYTALIKAGDEAFEKSNWDASITKYEEALKLKANEKHPKDQIILAKKNKEEAEANAAKEEAFKNLMDAALQLKNNEKYQEAIDKYKEALTVKPTATEPKERIAEIEKIMADAADAAAKEEQYQKFMSDGQAAQDKDELTGAIDLFKKALETKPGDNAAQQKIDEINRLIKEKEAAEAKEKEFNDLIVAAKKDFDADKLTEAKVKYQKALSIKEDAEVKAKIKEIDDLIAKNADAAEQKAKYEAAIKAADNAFASKDYETALSKYEEAYAIKEEKEAQDGIAKAKAKIAEIADAQAKDQQFKDLVAAGDELSANNDYSAAIQKYKEAIKVKPDPAISKKIVDLEAKIREESANNALLAEYNAKIKEADNAFNSSNWEEAKSLYNAAIDIKGDEQYPKDQLDEIDRKMKEESENEIEKQYQKILSVAQSKMDAEDYEKALELYKRAKDMKPSDPLPQEKIDEINAIKAAKEKELADKEAFEKKYRDLIQSADQLFDNKDYTKALVDYKEALTMKSTEGHPKSRITEIEELLAKLDADAQLEEKYKAAIATADKLYNAGEYLEAKTAYEEALDIKAEEQYPKDQIDSCNKKLQDESENEIEKQYQKILTVAQKKFDEENYEKALELYNRAKDMKPSDPLPQNKIDEINQLIKDMASEKEKRDRYNKLIQDGDTQFEKGAFEKALPLYMDALDLYKEQYPTDQLEKCRQNMKKDDSGINKQYDKLIKKADEYFNSATYAKAKDLYERAVKLKPSDQYPKDKLKEIDAILNPPKELIGQSGELKNYGPRINEKPVDIDAMLNEAKEQQRYFEYEKIFDKRDEALDANSNWSETQRDEEFIAKKESERLQTYFDNVGDTGEKGRVESRDNVVRWEEDLNLEANQLVKTQNNDIQYQNKRVEAMTEEILENKMDDDKPREEYIADIEKIRKEIIKKNENDVNDQINTIQTDKNGINEIVESHVTSDPNNDVDRLNTVVEVEDWQITLISENNENVRNQEDELMNVKNETELLVDDIVANQMDDDVNRVESLEVIEEINISYEEREGENANIQEDNNQNMTVTIEDVRTEIIENQMDDDKPRQEVELIVAEKQDEFESRESKNMTNQTTQVMNNDEAIENIEIKIDQNNSKREEKREGYEEVLVELDDEITKYDSDLTNENVDKGFDTKDHTETMADQKEKLDMQGNKDAIKNADKTNNAIENHLDHISDDKIENDKYLEESENYIDELKDLDVNKITPELENSLGKKFPEGVTEESFAINDSNGLLKAYVTRRVVVIDGVGKVYEKTSTRYGHVSYTRNGEAISEYQWNDETSSAQIGRN